MKNFKKQVEDFFIFADRLTVHIFKSGCYDLAISGNFGCMTYLSNKYAIRIGDMRICIRPTDKIKVENNMLILKYGKGEKIIFEKI